MPRKEDLQMETGEYFLNEQERDQKKKVEQREAQKAKSMQRKAERAKEYDPLAAASAEKAKKRPREDAEAKESTKDLASRLVDKAASSKSQKKAKAVNNLLL